MKKIILAIFTIMLAVAIFGCGKTVASTGASSGGGGGGGGIVPYTGTLKVSGTVNPSSSLQGFRILGGLPDVGNKAITVYEFNDRGLQPKDENGFDSLKTENNGKYELPELNAEKLYIIEVDTSPTTSAFVFGQGNKTINVDPLASAGVRAIINLLDREGLFYKNVNAAYFARFIESALADIGKHSEYILPIFQDEDKDDDDLLDYILGDTPIITEATQLYLNNVRQEAIGNGYSVPVAPDWSESLTAIDNLKLAENFDAGNTPKIENIKLSKTADNATLNVSITFDKALPDLSSDDKWKGIRHGYFSDWNEPISHSVSNKASIRIDLMDVLGGDCHCNVEIVIYEGLSNNWEALYAIHTGNKTEWQKGVNWGTLPIDPQNNNMKFSIPIRPEMPDKMYLTGSIVAYREGGHYANGNDTDKGIAHSKTYLWRYMSLVPQTRVNIR
jgi:hypothetical protein